VLQVGAEGLDLGEHFGVTLLRPFQVLGGQLDDESRVGFRPLCLTARERVAEPTLDVFELVFELAEADVRVDDLGGAAPKHHSWTTLDSWAGKG
jgi:hypothetical protein